MSFELIYTGVVLVLMTLALVKEFVKPAFVVFSALILLTLGGVVDLQEAFSGFSNSGMLTVAILYVVSASLQSSEIMEGLVSFFLRGSRKQSALSYLKLMFPISFVSAFVNNTPVVAALVPIVKKWARLNGIAPSKLLIPVSYAAILGGICTLIGTSTNLVVHGMMIQKGMEGFGFFEITKLGLPVAVFGILLMSFLGAKLLPDRRDIIQELGENTREFVAEMKVTREYPYIGKTITQAGLRHLKGLFLFQVERAGEIIAPVSPDERILVGDRLFFTGLPETIVELQRVPGLEVVKDSEFDLSNYDSDRVKLYEAVVSSSSDLVGKNVRESNFRKVYDAVILAIHRSGERVRKKVGDIVIKPGDTLLLLAKDGFDKKWYNRSDFSLVSKSVEVYSKPRWKTILAIAIFAAMIVVATLKILPILLAAALAAILMVVLGIVSPEKARDSIDLNVLLVIACSFGIGRAVENSGLAGIIAKGVIGGLSMFGTVGILAGIYFLASVYTELITNNAAAAIMFPVAYSAATFSGVDPRPFMLVLAIGASASFATPIGYQTNLMVYGPGGYKFKDFLKSGIIMNVSVGIFVVVIAALMFY